MIQKFNIKNNTYIRYDVIGKGPPILLLHTIRNRLEYSDKLGELLKARFTVYSIDLPGFGDSPINKDTIYKEPNYKKKESTIDIHGFSLDQANRRIEKFVINCYEKKIEKLNIITGKGLRSRS